MQLNFLYIMIKVSSLNESLLIKFFIMSDYIKLVYI